jgi:hypothetical protein
MQAAAQPRAPGLCHVREARAERVGVAADQRRPPGQVDVVVQDHERPGTEGRIQPTGRVRQHHDPGSKSTEQQHRLDDEAWIVPFVEVEAALEHDHGATAETPHEQPAGVTRSCRRRPTRESVERDRHRLFQLVRKAAQPRPEHDPDVRHDGRPVTHGGDQCRDALWLGAREDRLAGVEGHSGGVRHGGLRAWAASMTGPCGRRGNGGGFVAPDGSIDTGMPIASRRAPPRGRAAVRRPRDRGQRSARSDRRRTKALDVISVSASCRPLRARPTLSAGSADGQRAYPRTSE